MRGGRNGVASWSHGSFHLRLVGDAGSTTELRVSLSHPNFPSSFGATLQLAKQNKVVQLYQAPSFGRAFSIETPSTVPWFTSGYLYFTIFFLAENYYFSHTNTKKNIVFLVYLKHQIIINKTHIYNKTRKQKGGCTESNCGFPR